MKEKFSDDEFVSLLEILEQALRMLEDMDDAFELIESYIEAVNILKGVSE